MSLERNYKLYVHIAPNGKKYYGITKQKPEYRWQNGYGYKNQVFYRAISKYGWDNIEHIILFDDLTESEAKELEQYYIQWYNTTNPQYGYNISLGGDGSNHSEETRKKLSETHKGKHFSEETRKKLSEAHKGKHHSEETKKKLSEVHKGRFGKLSPASKPIICITTKKLFYGLAEANREYGIAQTNISNCCKGQRKSAGKLPDGTKLVWRYIDIIEL